MKMYWLQLALPRVSPPACCELGGNLGWGSDWGDGACGKSPPVPLSGGNWDDRALGQSASGLVSCGTWNQEPRFIATYLSMVIDCVSSGLKGGDAPL